MWLHIHAGIKVSKTVIQVDLTENILSCVIFGYYDFSEGPGGRLNKKDGLTKYGNSHVKDKTS